MEMGTLRMFCDLGETRSFRQTAERNGVTTSAVGQSLRVLEKKFGARLAVRRRGCFQLTAAGMICHEHCRTMIRLADELERRMAAARAAAGNVIELAACYSIGLHQLPPVLKQFQREFPPVQVQVRYASIDRVHDAVLDNAVDLGLTCYPQRRHGLMIEPFRLERLLLVCHPRHRLAARPAVALADLPGETFVAWSELHRSPFLRRVPSHLSHHFEPVHEFREVEMVKRAVELNAGIAILPEATVRSELASLVLCGVPFENGGHTEPLAVIHRRRKKLTPAMEHFIATLKQSGGMTN